MNATGSSEPASAVAAKAKPVHPVGQHISASTNSGFKVRRGCEVSLPAIDDGWTATGDGIIDWPALFPLFKQTKADHIAAEHDNPADWQSFARRSINYLRAAGL